MEKDKETSNDFTNYNGSVGDSMKQIQSTLETLVKEIKESDEYRLFIEAKRELEKDPEKFKIANEYRAINFQLQTSENQMNLFDEIENLEKEYSYYLKDKVIEDYLQSEVDLCNMLREVNRAIVESLQIDVGFVK